MPPKDPKSSQIQSKYFLPDLMVQKIIKSVKNVIEGMPGQ